MWYPGNLLLSKEPKVKEAEGREGEGCEDESRARVFICFMALPQSLHHLSITSS